MTSQNGLQDLPLSDSTASVEAQPAPVERITSTWVSGRTLNSFRPDRASLSICYILLKYGRTIRTRDGRVLQSFRRVVQPCTDQRLAAPESGRVAQRDPHHLEYPSSPEEPGTQSAGPPGTGLAGVFSFSRGSR